MDHEKVEESFVMHSFVTKFTLLAVVSALMFVVIFLCLHGAISFAGGLPGAFYIWSIAFIGIEALHKAAVLTAYLMSPFLALLTISSLGYDNLEDSQLTESSINCDMDESSDLDFKNNQLRGINKVALFPETDTISIKSGLQTPPRNERGAHRANQTWAESPIKSEENNTIDDASFSSGLINYES